MATSKRTRVHITLSPGEDETLDAGVPEEHWGIGPFVCKSWLMVNEKRFAAIGQFPQYPEGKHLFFVELRPIPELQLARTRSEHRTFAEALERATAQANALFQWVDHLLAPPVKIDSPTRARNIRPPLYALVPKIRVQFGGLHQTRQAAAIYVLVDCTQYEPSGLGNYHHDIARELVTKIHTPTEIEFYSRSKIVFHPERIMPTPYEEPGHAEVRNVIRLKHGVPTLTSSLHSSGIPVRTLVAFASITHGWTHGLELNLSRDAFLDWAQRDCSNFLKRFVHENDPGEWSVNRIDGTLAKGLNLKWSPREGQSYTIYLTADEETGEASCEISPVLKSALRSTFNQVTVAKRTGGINKLHCYTGQKLPLQ